jgi:membrane protein DedA with SNARE-associated domain
MEHTLRFLLENGSLVLLVFVLAEQGGLPVSAVPIMLAAGALAATGRLSLAAAIATSTIATMIPDLLWYRLGQSRGASILKLLCRVSLEPDTCVRRTENVFSRHGSFSLIYSKFVPGLSMAAPPLAGLFRMGLARFILFDGLGAMLWSLAYILPGYVFHRQLEGVARFLLRTGGWLGLLIAASLGGYILWRYLHRRRVLRELMDARITPEELYRKLQNGENVAVVDLRHRIDVELDAARIPGALWIPVEELPGRATEIPKDREVVLYCS